MSNSELHPDEPSPVQPPFCNHSGCDERPSISCILVRSHPERKFRLEPPCQHGTSMKRCLKHPSIKIGKLLENAFHMTYVFSGYWRLTRLPNHKNEQKMIHPWSFPGFRQPSMYIHLYIYMYMYMYIYIYVYVYVYVYIYICTVYLFILYICIHSMLFMFLPQRSWFEILVKCILHPDNVNSPWHPFSQRQNYRKMQRCKVMDFPWLF